jgi:hypothetical protein
MKKAIILTVYLLCMVNFYSKAQEFGDAAEKVRFLVQMHVQEYYDSRGYHQIREDYKVLMANGSISEVILQQENVPEMFLRRPISFRTRYVMNAGVLNRVLKEYFDVSVSDLVKSFKANYNGNKINDYYFNDDYSAYTKIYLGSNQLATAETKTTKLSDFPPSVRETIKKSMNEAKNRITLQQENERITQAQREVEDYSFRHTRYDLGKYDTTIFNRFLNVLKKNFLNYCRNDAPEYKDLWYGYKGASNGFISYNNVYNVLYEMEDNSRETEQRGNVIIAGSNDIRTVVSGQLLSGTDNDMKIVRKSSVPLPMITLSGRKVLTKAKIDSMRISFVKGITIAKCGKKGVEFTKFPPQENIKPYIEGVLAEKKGRFIIRYEVANILNESFTSITFKPYIALFGEYQEEYKGR